jgi:HPt (histidine-containing phosphotransfer) domain-containing protein
LLTPGNAVDQVRLLRGYHETERAQLDMIRRYWRGRQAIPAVIEDDAARIVKIMARIARVNVCPIVVDSLTQATFVDGFRSPKLQDEQDSKVWQVWQRNKMDARQTGLHRATYGYGTGYTVVLPGDPVPVIRCVSPRRMTAMYGEDPDWPMWALERASRAPDGSRLWKLYDDQAVYYVSETERATDAGTKTTFTFIEARAHNIGYVPVIRYLDEDDLDGDDEAVSATPELEAWTDLPTRGQIAPLMVIQDQIDMTTFDLLVAQHYAAFRQRYVLGWVPESSQEMIKATASRLMYFEGQDPDAPAEGLQVGEFAQTDIGGYLKSRSESLKHAATLSQTPVHELVGELVNLSAEALAAAEAGHERKVGERKTLLGESHEQTLRLVGKLVDEPIPDDAQVIWRDTSARTFAATVDGLGKLAQMLQIPPDMLWERIPGVTQQDVETWKAARQQGDSFEQLAALLNK